MKLLDGKLYDPTTAVNKVTTSLLAMTAIDTTNLRLTVTVPKSGKILCRMGAQVHGATTLPAIMLGVLEGSTLRGRRAPMVGGGNLAATGIYAAECEFMITGLTPGASFVADAAYGVETVVASTGLKYGGPNNTTANDNFGGFQFELWDPDPYTVDASGNVQADVREVNGTAQTAGDLAALITTADTVVDAIKVKTDFLPSATAGAAGGVFIAGANAATSITTALTANLIGNVTGNLSGSAGSVTGAVGSVTGAVGSVTGAVGSVTGLTAADVGLIKAKTDNLPSDPADASVIAGRFDSVDTAISALPAAPSAADVRAEIDANSTKLDAAVSTRLASADYVAPDNAGVAAIQAKTDPLTFTVANKLDVHSMVVNGTPIIGTGTEIDPWRGGP